MFSTRGPGPAKEADPRFDANRSMSPISAISTGPAWWSVPPDGESCGHAVRLVREAENPPGNAPGMRAAAVRSFRAPVELLELPVPSPGPNEVAVRLEAAGMNPFDWKIADGALEGRRPHVFPLVLGVDGCGVVERVGEKAKRFRVGTRVAGSFLHDPVGVGTYAEHTVAPETNALAEVPPGVEPGAAAALPTAGLAALDAIERLGLSEGRKLLIVGASGGVGSFAIQLARSRGASVVVAARPASHARLRSLGASGAIAPEAWDSAKVEQLAGPAGFDGLLDLVSDSQQFARWARWLRPGAVAATTVGATDPGRGVRRVAIDMRPSSRGVEELLAEVVRGTLVVPVERTISLDEVPQAVGESRAGRASGKTVIALG